MKTIIIYMATVTLINAGILLHDGFLFVLGAASAIALRQHSKTLRIKKFNGGCGKEF